MARVSGEEVRGSMHPDLVIDSLTDEKGRDVRYERNDKHLTLYPEGSKEIDIKFHGKPYDEVWDREMVGEYTQTSTMGILELLTKPKKPIFFISAPKSFTILKLMEFTVDIEVKDSMAMGYTRFIGGEDPSVEPRDNRVVYTFRTIETDLWFISSEYVSSHKSRDGVNYSVYLFPEHEGMLNKTMNLAQRLIEVYSQGYYPYPLGEFRVVEVPLGGTNYANERYSTSLIMLGRADIYRKSLGVEPNLDVEDYINTASVLIHETSHFWFGGVVASELLNEGLATFSEILFTESFDPELSKELREYYTKIVMKTSDWQNVSLAGVDWSKMATGNIGYYKGGMVVYMLYQLLGEDLFDVFHEYFERYGGVPGAYNKASLDDFISIVNEKKDMSWFFDEWVYKPGLPDYELSNLSITRRLRGYRLEFDVIQKEEVYRMPVEISAGSNTQIFMIDQRIERVAMDVDKLPERITLDPDYKIPKQKEAYLTVEPSILDRCLNICR